MVNHRTLFFLIFFSTAWCKAHGSERVILYTFYTPSHQVLLEEWFLPSLQDDFEVVVKRFEQECSGIYMTHGWTDVMLRKVQLIIDAIQEQWGNIVVYADVDIQFFAPIENLITHYMTEYDLAVQQDNDQGALCAGFMAIRANEPTLKLFKKIRKRMITNPSQSDQPTLNALLLKEKYTKVRWRHLPSRFFGTATVSCATFANQKTWREGDHVVIPQNILLHHANYTQGIENKIKLLAYVKKHWMNPPVNAAMIRNCTAERKKQRKKRLKEKRHKQSIGLISKKRRIKKRRQPKA